MIDKNRENDISNSFKLVKWNIDNFISYFGKQKREEKLDQKLDEKLKPVYDRLDKLESDMKYVRVVQLENQIIPRLNMIEQCYLDTSKRYMEKTEQIDTTARDIAVLQNVVENHSERLNQLSV